MNSFSVEDRIVNSWTHAVAVEKQPPDAVAQKWVEANADRVVEWVMAMYAAQKK